jgi:hypothetical protein
MKLFRLIPLAVLAAAAVAVVAGFNPMGAGAVTSASPYTCAGGSIPAGTYSSLTVAGPCTVDAGSVMVQRDVTVLPKGVLAAAFGNSNLTIGRNLYVLRNGAAVVGCEPEAFICLNDPDQTTGTMTTDDTIGGDLAAVGALAVLMHHNTIHGSVRQIGGGGGVNCFSQPALFGSPAYASYEDNTIGGSVNVVGFRSCWLGLFRNTIGGYVNFQNNNTADRDGNEIATNTITGWLNCSANSPVPQFGDSGGSPNTAAGGSGQCAGTGIVAPAPTPAP